MIPIQYLGGDVTQPQGEGNKLIAHVCNNVLRFDAGVALAIARRWPKAEEVYMSWPENRFGHDPSFKLGEVQFVEVGGVVERQKLIIANMLAQEGLRTRHNRIPLRYEALGTCLWKVCQEAKRRNASVHMPRIGAGRAGGWWDQIEQLIISNISIYDIPVFVYDFSEK